jgi:hypothetical protein
MLSNSYRQRLLKICQAISSNSHVPLNDIVWVTKLAKANTSARNLLQQARKLALNNNPPDSLDSFITQLNIGDPDPQNHLSSLNSIDDLVNWFKQDKPDDWRQRD